VEHQLNLVTRQISRHNAVADSSTIEIWRVPLCVTAHEVAVAADTLTWGEVARAAHFCFQPDRERFVATRGALRHILSEYLREPADEVRLQVKSNGKPTVVAEDCDLRFNSSYRGDWALHAVTLNREVGIDIEHADPRFADVATISEQMFAPAEAAAITALHVSARVRGFFACWTRKEAFLKALGDGLSRPLNSFAIYSGDDEPRGIWDRGMYWSVQTFAPADGYIASVVFEGRGAKLRLRRWQWPGSDHCSAGSTDSEMAA
jgi:4'-phosphopantetheinyl transferase